MAEGSSAARMSLEEAFFLAYALECLTVYQAGCKLSEQVTSLPLVVQVFCGAGPCSMLARVDFILMLRLEAAVVDDEALLIS